MRDFNRLTIHRFQFSILTLLEIKHATVPILVSFGTPFGPLLDPKRDLQSLFFFLTSVSSFLMDVLNEILTFAPVWDPKIELQRNKKAVQIEVGKQLSKMFPKGTLLGVHLGSKMAPKRKL